MCPAKELEYLCRFHRVCQYQTLLMEPESIFLGAQKSCSAVGCVRCRSRRLRRATCPACAEKPRTASASCNPTPQTCRQAPQSRLHECAAMSTEPPPNTEGRVLWVPQHGTVEGPGMLLAGSACCRAGGGWAAGGCGSAARSGHRHAPDQKGAPTGSRFLCERLHVVLDNQIHSLDQP